MLSVRGASCRRPVRVSRRVEPSVALRVGDNDVAVHQGVGRRSAKTAIEPCLLDLDLTACVAPRPGLRGLEHLGRDNAPGGPSDPGEDIAKGVVPADDKSANLARQGVETISVQRLQALAARRSRR